jgi:hypothetical protein
MVPVENIYLYALKENFEGKRRNPPFATSSGAAKEHAIICKNGSTHITAVKSSSV